MPQRSVPSLVLFGTFVSDFQKSIDIRGITFVDYMKLGGGASVSGDGQDPKKRCQQARMMVRIQHDEVEQG